MKNPIMWVPHKPDPDIRELARCLDVVGKPLALTDNTSIFQQSTANIITADGVGLQMLIPGVAGQLQVF